jgi:hypothetical protein
MAANIHSHLGEGSGNITQPRERDNARFGREAGAVLDSDQLVTREDADTQKNDQWHGKQNDQAPGNCHNGIR